MAIDEAESWTPVEWVINSVKVRHESTRIIPFSLICFGAGKGGKGLEWIGLVADGEK